MGPLSVARQGHLVTTVINKLNSGVIIKRNQIVAQASKPFEAIKETLSSTSSFNSPLTQLSSPNTLRQGQIDTMNEKHRNTPDDRRHEAPLNGRRSYIISKL